MMRRGSWVVVLGMLVLRAGSASAETALVTPADTKTAEQWVQRHLVETPVRNAHPAELQVSSCHGELLRNSRAGRPLVIAGQEYRHGLLAHAPSKLVVQLDSPGKTFSAIVGVDSNEQTRQGQGSVVFVVTAGGKIAVQSAVLREGMNGVPVVVDLDGATSFVLEATDAGDGIACDHADWAEAKVTFADGREQSLGDLPPASEGSGLPFSFVYGGTASRWLLPLWEREDETETLDAKRVQRTIPWKDAKTRLEVSCKSIEYRDFPVVEWTLHFRNGGTAETPILEEIRASGRSDREAARWRLLAPRLPRGRLHSGQLPAVRDPPSPRRDPVVRPTRRPAHRGGIPVLQPRDAGRGFDHGTGLAGTMECTVRPRGGEHSPRCGRPGANPFQVAAR